MAHTHALPWRHYSRTAPLWLSLLIAVAPGALAQREFFIDSETGVDSPSCGEVATPCQTIRHTDALAINETNAVLRLAGTHYFGASPYESTTTRYVILRYWRNIYQVWC